MPLHALRACSWPNPFIAQFSLELCSIDVWVQDNLAFVCFRHLGLVWFYFYVSYLNTWRSWRKARGWFSLLNDLGRNFAFQLDFADIFNTKSNSDSAVLTLKLWNFWSLSKHFFSLLLCFLAANWVHGKLHFLQCYWRCSTALLGERP